mmetsp:Transcript_5040/g.7576  ORF Transcript_5040/g.7576 Transcript_5040/m.7576 type:complete len:324 (-) Transcript_5040:79-1050(-)
MRRQMIVKENLHLFWTFVVGVLGVIPCEVSLAMIYRKFKQDIELMERPSIRDLPNFVEYEYNTAMIPLIWLSLSICIVILVNLINILRDSIENGPLVWIRDAFGQQILYFTLHLSILTSLVKLKEYVKIKEEREWEPDSATDNIMDFYDAFRPIFVLVGLYLVKVSLIKATHDFGKVILALASVGIAFICHSYFDSDQHNNVRLELLALPISVILVGQVVLEWATIRSTTDRQKRLFYFLDTTQKMIWFVGNLVSTIIYCICLLRWLWIIETNHRNEKGRREDAKAVHLALSTFIFYSIFLIERMGTYILDIVHCQFETDLLR